MKGWTCDELDQVVDEVDQFDRAVSGGLSSIFTWTIPVKRVQKINGAHTIIGMAQSKSKIHSLPNAPPEH